MIKHLGDNYPFRPMDRGFQESLIHGGGVVGETPDYWDNNYYDDVDFRNGKPEQVEGYCTDVWFNETMRFIEKNKGRPIFVNPAKQQTVLISSQNLLGDEVAYSQRHVRRGMPSNGWTVIDVEVPGTYRIALCRWPRESGLAIRAEAPPCPKHPSTHRMTKNPCKVMKVVNARLKVGEFDRTADVIELDEEVVFEVDLAAGEQRIQTWFTLQNGEQFAAYFTYIEGT